MHISKVAAPRKIQGFIQGVTLLGSAHQRMDVPSFLILLMLAASYFYKSTLFLYFNYLHFAKPLSLHRSGRGGHPRWTVQTMRISRACVYLWFPLLLSKPSLTLHSADLGEVDT